MSGFLGTSGGSDGGIPFAADDRRHVSRRFQDYLAYWFIRNDDLWFRDRFWPGRSGFDSSGGEMLEALWAELPDFNTGAISKRGFSGYTRDVNGVAIAGVTVRLFRTSDSLLTSQVVSDAQGFFTLDTPFYPDTHFYTAHKADVPEIAGASPSTLVAG